MSSGLYRTGAVSTKRGADVTQEGLFIVRKTSDCVATEHPLRAIREILNTALRDMDRLFESMYERAWSLLGAPKWLLRGLVLQALYGIRSERLLCEQLGYNMLFRWFVGLGMENAAWDHSSLHAESRPVDRSRRDQDVVRTRDATSGRSQAAFCRAFQRGRHLIRAWASIRSFVPKDGPPPTRPVARSNPEVDFKHQKAQQRDARRAPAILIRSCSPSRRKPRALPSLGQCCWITAASWRWTRA